MDYDDYLPYIHKLEIVNAALLEALEAAADVAEALAEKYHDFGLSRIASEARAAIRQAKGGESA